VAICGRKVAIGEAALRWQDIVGKAALARPSSTRRHLQDAT
jgi:hypothetical protein